MSTRPVQIAVTAADHAFLSHYAKARSSTPTRVLHELLHAVQEGRIQVPAELPLEQRVSVRLEGSLHAWFTSEGHNLAQTTRSLLQALREGRIDIDESISPNPFPIDPETP